MRSGRYVALLRGINVGGRNNVAMSDLRAAFEAGGHREVSTYIRSGNVLFASQERRDGLEDAVERLLAERLGLGVVVVVRSHRQLRDVVRRAPDGFGAGPDTHHSDVVFLKAPLTAQRALRAFELRDGVDRAWPGPGVVYFERLSARRGQSRMSRVTAAPEYGRMTIRSWSTTTRLSDLLDDGAGTS